MRQLAQNYARVLFELKLTKEVLDQTGALLSENKQLRDALASPIVKKRQKDNIIDRIFDAKVAAFLKVLCANGHIELFTAINEAFEEILLEQNHMVATLFSYTSEPSEEQVEGIKKMIVTKYKKAGVLLTLKKDPSLIGGFILKVGDDEYDNSVRGRLLRLSNRLAWR